MINFVIRLIVSLMNAFAAEHAVALPSYENHIGYIQPQLVGVRRNVRLLVKAGKTWVSRSLEDVWSMFGSINNSQSINSKLTINWITIIILIIKLIIVILLFAHGNVHHHFIIGGVMLTTKDKILELLKSGTTEMKVERSKIRKIVIRMKSGKLYPCQDYVCPSCGKTVSKIPTFNQNITCSTIVDGTLCNTNMEPYSEEMPPMLLSFWCKDNGIDMYDSFRVFEIEPDSKKEMKKINKLLTVGNWCPIGKYRVFNGKGIVWAFDENIMSKILNVFADVGSIMGYGQLLTSSCYRGVKRVDWKFRYVNKSPRLEGDGDSWIRASKLAEFLEIDEKAVVCSQFRALGSFNNKLNVSKGIVYPTNDESILNGADMILDKDQMKIGKGSMKDGEEFIGGVFGIAGLDGEGKNSNYIGWQVIQQLKNTKMVRWVLRIKMFFELVKVLYECNTMWTNTKSRLKILSRLAIKTDNQEVNEKEILENQMMMFQLLCSNIPKEAKELVQSRLATHFYVLEVSKMAMASGIKGYSWMLKSRTIEEAINGRSRDRVGIRYPFLSNDSLMLCSRDGKVDKVEASYAQGDNDGDKIAILKEVSSLDRAIVDMFKRYIYDRTLVDGKHVPLDINESIKCTADTRTITKDSLRVKLLEQMQQMEIGEPNNHMQVAMAIGDHRMARVFAQICHLTAQVLKKYPTNKSTGERIEADGWYAAHGLTQEDYQDYGINLDMFNSHDRAEARRNAEFNNAFNVAREWKKYVDEKLRVEGLISINVLETGLNKSLKGHMSYVEAREIAKRYGYKNLGILNESWASNLKMALDMWSRTKMAAKYRKYSEFSTVLEHMRAKTNKSSNTKAGLIKELENYVSSFKSEKGIESPISVRSFLLMYGILCSWNKEINEARGWIKGQGINTMSTDQKSFNTRILIKVWRSRGIKFWNDYARIAVKTIDGPDTKVTNKVLKDTRETIWKSLLIWSALLGNKLGSICLPKGITPMDVYGWDEDLLNLCNDKDTSDMNVYVTKLMDILNAKKPI